jgi:hypothetical protein
LTVRLGKAWRECVDCLAKRKANQGARQRAYFKRLGIRPHTRIDGTKH